MCLTIYLWEVGKDLHRMKIPNNKFKTTNGADTYGYVAHYNRVFYKKCKKSCDFFAMYNKIIIFKFI